MKSLFNDDNIDDIFRRELKDYRVAAPKGVWDRINSQLHVKRNPLAIYLAASVFMAGLFALGWWSINSSNSVIVKNKSAKEPAIAAPVNTTQVVNSIAQNTILPSPAKTTLQLSALPKGKINTNTETQTENGLSIYSQPVITSSTNTVAEQAGATKMSTSPSLNAAVGSINDWQNMPVKTTSIVVLDDAKSLLSYNDITQPQFTPTPVTLSNKNIKGFYTGINGSVNSVWILDRGALNDNNFDYQITGGFTYGVQAGYNFSNNFGVETGITINAKDGQRYTYYLNNVEPESKRVALNYTEIPLIAKLKIPQISAFTEMPLILNINFGLSYGYLRSSYTFVNGDKAGSQNQYPNNQLNALAGFSYDIYTRHSFSYSIGLMAEYGVNTINNSSQGLASIAPGNSALAYGTLPSRYANGSDFISPHNLSMGITVAINYNFSLFSR